MADRTAAQIFGNLFNYLASEAGQANGPIAARIVAEWAWKAAQEYDFDPFQLEAGPALVTLALAKRTKIGGKETILYPGEF